MSVEAVLFDMDGVLVDSEPIHLATTNEVLARRGAYLEPALYRTFMGLPELPFFRLLAERLSLAEPPESLARERAALSLQRMAAQPLVPLPGALECLLRLRADGLALALASSASRLQVDLVVARLGLARVLGAVVALDDVAAGKPAPDLFLEAARRLSVAPSGCAVVEDSALGIRAARAAGMLPLALVPPEQDDAAHRAAGAVACLHSLDALTVDALGEWVSDWERAVTSGDVVEDCGEFTGKGDGRPPSDSSEGARRPG